MANTKKGRMTDSSPVPGVRRQSRTPSAVASANAPHDMPRAMPDRPIVPTVARLTDDARGHVEQRRDDRRARVVAAVEGARKDDHQRVAAQAQEQERQRVGGQRLSVLVEPDEEHVHDLAAQRRCRPR